ncbi:unnamed protein product [Ilex paraguariensis]|uniref:cytokinin riboside 5'-monophosphate phosphoribohydrolase n=1 Tax=Ilex paraguariensis TaxID=185542 RepID=A0ABC8UH50_9AQUA
MEEKAVKSRFRRVCVFCGSSTGKRNCYKDAALELGKELKALSKPSYLGFWLSEGLKEIGSCLWRGQPWINGLDFSGSPSWWRACLRDHPQNSNVQRDRYSPLSKICIMLQYFSFMKQITGETVGEVRPVDNMHQRKAEMARHSDCFIALPGFCLTLTPTHPDYQTDFNPVGLLNVDGYYNSLLTFIDKAVDDEFIKPSQRHIIVSAPTAGELVHKLEEYVPVHDGVVAKARWEAEQVEHNAALQSEIAR